MPNIGVEVHNDLRTLPTAASPTRVALSFRGDEWLSPDNRLKILDMVMAGLPLDGLVMLAAYNLSSWYEQNLETQHFWHRFSPKWPLLHPSA